VVLMSVFVGIPSYNRARVLGLCLRSFLGSKLVRGFIVVADAITASEAELYVKAIKEVEDAGFEVIHDMRIGRRGSAKARNKVFEIARENLAPDDVIIQYEDDYLYPGDKSLEVALQWLRNESVGIVGGRRINLRKRRIDPDFALNIPYLADRLTRATGFIVLNMKHGPREVEYTTHLMAMKVRIINLGIKYDEGYGGTGYREESDLQRQVRELGYKIVFEPRFYVYHLAVEEGGDRYSDLEDRMYWKWRNHTYFMEKWRYPIAKKVLSYAILTVYALLSGPPAIRGIMKAVKNR
jgi:GT2 family glycosyltransferase